MTWSPDRFVVIIGAPRSGTTWIHAMLGAHPDACATAELMLFNLYTVPWEEAYRHQEDLAGNAGRLGLPLLWSAEDLDSFLREFLDRAYAQVLARKPGARLMVDKHPGYSGHTAHIDRLCPGARFIHVIRDGRDVVASLLEASRGWGSRWAPSKVDAAVMTWTSFVAEARKAARHRDRYLEVRYEDLFTRGRERVAGIFRFCGIDADPALADRICRDHVFDRMKQSGTGAGPSRPPDSFFRKGRVGDWRNVLPARTRYRVHEPAGPLLRDLGYTRHGDAWWALRPGERLTLPIRGLADSQQRRRRRRVRALRQELGPHPSQYAFTVGNLLLVPPRKTWLARIRRAAADILGPGVARRWRAQRSRPAGEGQR